MCILLVEDDLIVRCASQLVLEDAGFEVMSAADGDQAWTMLDQNPNRFSCLVTDSRLPGTFNGMELVDETRALYPAIPICVVSGHPLDFTPDWARRQRVEFLLKPCDPAHLVRTITQLLASGSTP